MSEESVGIKKWPLISFRELVVLTSGGYGGGLTAYKTVVRLMAFDDRSRGDSRGLCCRISAKQIQWLDSLVTLFGNLLTIILL